MERRKIQDKKDLKAAYRLAAQEANFKYPLSSQTDALKNIQYGKNEDMTWCSQKLEFWKYKARIIDVSISGERATKRRPAKAFIKIDSKRTKFFVFMFVH